MLEFVQWVVRQRRRSFADLLNLFSFSLSYFSGFYTLFGVVAPPPLSHSSPFFP